MEKERIPYSAATCQYPRAGKGRARIYVKYPVEIEAIHKDNIVGFQPEMIGKWAAVDVMLPSGFKFPYPIRLFEDSRSCQASCEVHNLYNGWTIEAAERIVDKSKGIL